MPWPKGVKRTGYIKKDGSAHRKRGDLHIQVVTKPEPKLQVVTKPDPAIMTVKKGPWKPSIAPCPKCGEPDAFTYCDNCGWYEFRPDCPHCKKGK